MLCAIRMSSRGDPAHRFATRICLVVACLAAVVAVVVPGQAGAEPDRSAPRTVWACHPDQHDDLCDGSLLTTTGYPPRTVGFRKASKPPIDCFYVYPTSTTQRTPNSDRRIPPEVARSVVQQFRQFSRVCDTYAPMYRQETFAAQENPRSYVYTPQTEVAYRDVLAAWNDYKAQARPGRGVVLVGHSQGAAHLGRLIAEEIDPVPAERDRLVGAILGGSPVFTKTRQTTGGMFANVPACTRPGETGCITAFITMDEAAGNVNAPVGDGYWPYPFPKPDPKQYERICTDPARLSGQKNLTPLINLDYPFGSPLLGSEVLHWRQMPNAVHSRCKRGGASHWLQAGFNGTPDPVLAAMVPLMTQAGNWHVPEMNVTMSNLIRITQLQTHTYLARHGR